MNIIEGNFSCADYKFAIVLSKFNELIGKRLLEGALECLKMPAALMKILI